MCIGSELMIVHNVLNVGSNKTEALMRCIPTPCLDLRHARFTGDTWYGDWSSGHMFKNFVEKGLRHRDNLSISYAHIVSYSGLPVPKNTDLNSAPYHSTIKIGRAHV